MSERLELPSSLSKGVAWENMKPHPGALTQCPLWWQCTNSSGRMVLEGERSFFSLLYFSSLCFPFPYSRGCSATMQFTASLASEQKADATKGNGKICKSANSPRAFQARVAKHERHLCNTYHRDSLMTEAVHDAVLISMNGTSRTSKNSPLMRILTAGLLCLTQENW